MSNKLGKFVWSAFFALLAINIAQAVVITGTNSLNQNSIFKAGYIRLSNTGSLTAFATGGQTSATPLPSAVNVVTTVATIADSVLLPTCQTGIGGEIGTPGFGNTDGMQVVVVNAATNSMNIFPQVGQSINALAVNTAFALAGGKTIYFTCGPAGVWFGNLSA